MMLIQILKSSKKKSAKGRNVNREIAKQHNFKDLKFPVPKKSMQK